MTIEQADCLCEGIYFIHWNTGGGSVAAVGRNTAGVPWIAPANWIMIYSPTFDPKANEGVWASVKAVELITTQAIELKRRGMH
jgi:hypothetical protein